MRERHCQGKVSGVQQIRTPGPINSNDRTLCRPIQSPSSTVSIWISWLILLSCEGTGASSASSSSDETTWAGRCGWAWRLEMTRETVGGGPRVAVSESLVRAGTVAGDRVSAVFGARGRPRDAAMTCMDGDTPGTPSFRMGGGPGDDEGGGSGGTDEREVPSGSTETASASLCSFAACLLQQGGRRSKEKSAAASAPYIDKQSSCCTHLSWSSLRLTLLYVSSLLTPRARMCIST